MFNVAVGSGKGNAWFEKKSRFGSELRLLGEILPERPNVYGKEEG
jgi:hypothetical protein